VNVRIEVSDAMPLERALIKMKRYMVTAGVSREARRHEQYTKPSEAKRAKRLRARRRAQKYARIGAERDAAYTARGGR
jgi:ribosomal protein S21